MIVILSPTAQLASETLSLNPPPTLSIKAEYGAFVLVGAKYTSAHNQPVGSDLLGGILIGLMEDLPLAMMKTYQSFLKKRLPLSQR